MHDDIWLEVLVIQINNSDNGLLWWQTIICWAVRRRAHYIYLRMFLAALSEVPVFASGQYLQDIPNKGEIPLAFQ